MAWCSCVAIGTSNEPWEEEWSEEELSDEIGEPEEEPPIVGIRNSQYLVIPMHPQDPLLSRQVKRFQTACDRKLLYQLVPSLMDERLSLADRLYCTRILPMTNDPEILVRIEKLFFDLVHQDQFTEYSKLKLCDNYREVTNGSMISETIEWVSATCLELSWILFQICQSVVHRIVCAQSLLRNLVQRHRQLQILQELERMSQDPERTVVELAEIADLLIHFGEPEATRLGNEVLARVREIEAQRAREEEARWAQIRPRLARPRQTPTVYSDSQNVHDANISQAVREAIARLMTDVETLKKIPETANQEAPHETVEQIAKVFREKNLPSVKKTFDRIMIDCAYFTNQYRLRIRDVLQKVWHRIWYVMSSEHQTEAILRLHQELFEASGVCSTGIVSRVINTLSGFPEDQGGFQVVKISWNDQIASNLQARINTRIRELPDEERKGAIVTAMVDEDREAYLVFLREIHDSLLSELRAEFTPYFEEGFSETDFLRAFEAAYQRMIS